MIYKQPLQIFDKWENDKGYYLVIGSKKSNEMESKVIYAKDIKEARRLAQFWLSDAGLALDWKVLGVEPVRK